MRTYQTQRLFRRSRAKLPELPAKDAAVLLCCCAAVLLCCCVAVQIVGRQVMAPPYRKIVVHPV